jgi:general secretion pathway protein F
MAVQENSPLGPISLDQLVALNDEIAALVRAGVPLEEGLAELGADMPGRLGTLMTRLAKETGRGKPLGEVLADPSAQLPPVYRAVVEAGLRAGRLPAALESVAGSIRRLAQMHRSVAIASLYPAIVLILACVLFAVFTAWIAPRMATASEYFQTPGRVFIVTLASWGRSAIYWGPAVPVLVVLLGAVGVCFSRRAVMFDSSRAKFSLLWLPWLGPMLRWSHAAIFTDLLATLVEHRVPLHEAILLAGNACGDPATLRAAQPLAAALERGGTIQTALVVSEEHALPPLLEWLIQGVQGQESMVSALKHAAETYRSRAQYQAELAQVVFPVVLTVAIGGTVTLLYLLSVLGPYIAILWGLS